MKRFSRMADTNEHRAPKLWTVYFFILCMVFLFQSLGFNMMNQVMALYVQGLFGKAIYAGYLNAAFSVAAITARMVGGYLSDRFPRRLVMTGSILLFAISVLLFGAVRTFIFLIILRGLQGLGFASAGTANNAAAADVLPKSRFSEGMGYLGLGSCIASAIGGSLVLMVSGSAGNYSRVIFFAGTMLLVAALMAFLCNYTKDKNYQQKIAEEKELESKNNRESAQYRGIQRIFEKTALPAAGVQFFSQFAYSCLNTYLLAYAVAKGFNGVGYYYTLLAAAMFMSSLFAGRLVDCLGVKKVVAPSLLVLTAAYFLLANVRGIVMLSLIGLAFGFGNGVTNIVMTSEGIRHAAPDRRGAASGTYYISSDIANGLGSVFWGLIIDHFSYRTAFTTAGITVALALVLAMFLFRKRKPA